jgi:hypothetical protein
LARSSGWATAGDHAAGIRVTWEHLIEFSREKGLADEFSANLLTRFLEEHRAMDEQVNRPGNDWRRHVAIGVKVLADFARTWRIERAVMDVQSIDLLPAMQNALRDYEQYCKDRLHLRPSTLHLGTIELKIFLDFLHSRKARALDQIQAADLSEFVSCRDHLQPETVARIVSDVCSFLRFLAMRGILQKDLSAELPKVRVPRDATFRRCGIRNSSSGFSVRSIALARKGNEITPFSYWHAGWDCALEIFAP